MMRAKKCPGCSQRFLPRDGRLYCGKTCEKANRKRTALALRLDLIELAVAAARSALDEVEKQTLELARGASS